MTKNELATEIETQRMIIGGNSLFTKGLPRGTDPKADASIAAARARLAELRQIEADMVQAEKDRGTLALIIEAGKFGSAQVLLASEIEALGRICARLEAAK
jgi:hypothetical protein